MPGKEVAEEEEKLLNYEASEEKPEVVKEPHSEEEKATWENLPHKKQLLLIALCRLSTPLSNACLLPYLYFLVKSILSDPEHPEAPQKISRLTGLLVAAYPLGQMATSMLWGHLSDTYGRKPAILIGLSISVTANLAFGFSRTIGMLLFWRVLAGMANGILGVMRTMTAEIVKEKKFQSRAFLAPPLIFNSGRVIALAVGGCLADPVDNLPSLFGPNGWFNVSNNPAGVEWTLKYPYALPALFNGTVLGFCLLAATLWLRESLPSKEHNWDMGLVIGDYISRFFGRIVLRNRNRAGYTPARMEEEEGLISDFPATQSPRSGVLTPPTTPKAKPYKPPFRDIWTRRLLKVLLVFTLFPLHNATFLHIFPVYLSLPGSSNAHPTAFHFSGGLGLASPTVGLYLATFGICGILLQLFLYPRVQRRIGTLGVLRLASCIFPIVYIVAPYLSLLAGNETWKWVGMAAVLFSQVMARTMAIPSNVILLTDAAPRRSVLGTIHGAGNMLSALASACGPVIGGALLARGIEIGAVGLVWWSWLFVAALLTLGCSFLVEGAKDGEDGRCEVGGE